MGHLVLFCGLAFLLLYVFRLQQTTRSALLLALSSIAVGLGQEFLQLQFKMRAFGLPEVFDLGVDLTGATLGWLGYAYFLRMERYLRIAYFILEDA